MSLRSFNICRDMSICLGQWHVLHYNKKIQWLKGNHNLNIYPWYGRGSERLLLLPTQCQQIRRKGDYLAVPEEEINIKNIIKTSYMDHTIHLDCLHHFTLQLHLNFCTYWPILFDYSYCSCRPWLTWMRRTVKQKIFFIQEAFTVLL